MEKKYFITKIIATIIFGIILTIASAIILPQGEWVSSGYALPGFPLPIFKSSGCSEPVPGCFNTKELPLNFAVNLLFWIIISAIMAFLICGLLKKKQ